MHGKWSRAQWCSIEAVNISKDIIASDRRRPLSCIGLGAVRVWTIMEKSVVRVSASLDLDLDLEYLLLLLSPQLYLFFSLLDMAVAQLLPPLSAMIFVGIAF